MFVARMILNTSSVAVHDARQLLAVSKSVLECHYFLSDQSGSCHLNIPITWRNNNKQVREFFNPSALNVVTMGVGAPCSHSVDKYMIAKDNSYLHLN